MMLRLQAISCALALVALVLVVESKATTAKVWNWKTAESSSPTSGKRTKASKHSDVIRTNDITPEQVKEVALTEAYSKGHSKKDSGHYGTRKYDKYKTYGKDDYDKYHKKYSKYDKNRKYKYDDCVTHKPEKHQCTAFFITQDSSDTGRILQSVHGEPLTLASTYTNTDVAAVSIFSNKARGAQCVGNDLEVVYQYQNGTQSAALFRYDVDKADIEYQTKLIENGEIVTWPPFVTSIKMPKGIYKIDAYNVLSLLPPNYEDSYRQYNLKSSSGGLVSTDLSQYLCWDLFVFSEDCKRWVCISSNPETKVFFKDPSTGALYIPPKETDPMITVANPELLTAGWDSSARVCDTHFMGGTSAQFHDPDTEIIFMRAKVSQKYPYFIGTEAAYSKIIPNVEISHVYTYSAQQSNIAYQCAGTWFWRFDEAYTAPSPLTPTVEMEGPWDMCYRILTFTECTNEVYVAATSTLWYSADGGRSFTAVDSSVYDPIVTNDLTGFTVKGYHHSH